MKAMTQTRERKIIVAILFFALVHGGIYASFLPPWGLIDEEHHLHYIQHLAETGSPPKVGQTYLSQEIITSLFETKRWETFGWLAPASTEAQQMGLEGHSYEGYQPPLYYALMAPIFMLLPQDMLVRLFSLRWIAVGISAFSLWLAYRTVKILFPQKPIIPLLVAFFLALNPERTASMSRVNNDVLLELLAIANAWICAKCVIYGITTRRSQWMGLLFGLAMITKTSAFPLFVLPVGALWFCRSSPYIRRQAAWTFGLSSLLILPWIIRNLYVYGDLTGLSAFKALLLQYQIEFQTSPLGKTLLLIPANLWVVWWQQGAVVENTLTKGLNLSILGFFFLSLVGLISGAWKRAGKIWGQKERLFLLYAILLIVHTITILWSYSSGLIPVMQGRFFLPVLLPAILFFVYGIYRLPLRTIWLSIFAILLILSDWIALLMIQMTAFYSTPVFEGQPWNETLPFIPSRMIDAMKNIHWDKPIFIQKTLVPISILYAIALLLLAIFWLQLWHRPASRREQ
jgi:hypothetical protein